jgi:F-type H+-transporting ATPase subunit b
MSHGSGHGDEHHAEFNWFHGLIGEKEGVEPSLLWRAPGTPVPFAATLFNTLLLIGLIVKFAKEPVARGLADRRQRIMRGMDDAAAMKEEARRQLEGYRHKLDNLDAEIERVKREMRETAEAERRRILEEAQIRRVRLEQEARVLVEQEMKAIHEQLTRETARAALSSARELLKSGTSTEDHRRFCEQYLETLQTGTRSGRVVGGRSEA